MKDSLEHQIGRLLIKSNLKLAVAESCTGGLVCDLITNIPGSSTYFLGGIVSYTNEAKQSLLNVQQKTLEDHGAVSAETVIEMARGIRSQFSTAANLDQIVGISVSGIAGPGGGSAEKPVGLVWIGLSSHTKDQTWKFQWSGNRQENKTLSARAALMILLQYLKNDSHEKN